MQKANALHDVSEKAKRDREIVRRPSRLLALSFSMRARC